MRNAIIGGLLHRLRCAVDIGEQGGRIGDDGQSAEQTAIPIYHRVVELSRGVCDLVESGNDGGAVREHAGSRQLVAARSEASIVSPPKGLTNGTWADFGGQKRFTLWLEVLNPESRRGTSTFHSSRRSVGVLLNYLVPLRDTAFFVTISTRESSCAISTDHTITCHRGMSLSHASGRCLSTRLRGRQHFCIMFAQCSRSAKSPGSFLTPIYKHGPWCWTPDSLLSGAKLATAQLNSWNRMKDHIFHNWSGTVPQGCPIRSSFLSTLPVGFLNCGDGNESGDG